jgi:hypothetical protein
MGSLWAKLVAVGLATAVAGVLVGFYIADYLRAQPGTVAYHAVLPPKATTPQTNVTLQTVASIGHGPHPDWVSYFARNPQGKWEHSTVLKVPAHSLIRMTIYQFDTATGLRNPFFGQPRGIVGAMKVDGKVFPSLPPDDASHTFAIPDLGVSVPLKGVADDAPNQCSYAPCSLSTANHKVQFTFRTGAPGTIRWQCFVPCAAGFILGFGGPMQTLGYMDGLLEVV